MKRVISKKVSGVSNKGNAWYMLVFAESFEAGELHESDSMFVQESTFNAVNEGDELKVFRKK